MRKDQMAEINKANAKAKEDFKEVLSSEAGKRVLTTIKNMCGYNSSSLQTGEKGEIMVNNVLVAEGARLVWVKLRNLVDESILKEIEKKG